MRVPQISQPSSYPFFSFEMVTDLVYPRRDVRRPQSCMTWRARVSVCTLWKCDLLSLLPFVCAVLWYLTIIAQAYKTASSDPVATRLTLKRDVL